MKKLYRNLIVLLLLGTSSVAFAKFRDIDSTGYEDEIPVMNIDDMEIHTSNRAFETLNAVQDNNQKLYGIAGKSQVLNFDKNIARVSITNNEVADVVVLSPRQVLINGKQAGSTSILFWSDKEGSPIFYNLIIQQNSDSFIQAVEQIAPNENIKIIFNDTGAVLSGKVSSSTVKERILNLAKAYEIQLTDITESPDKQVLLEVKITEASKNFTRELGVNFVNGRGLNMSNGKIAVGGWTPTAGTPMGYKTHVIQSSGGQFSLGFFRNGSLGIDFEASEAKGDIKILAEPKLLAVNGQQGSFSVGNEVPVPSGLGQYGNVAYTYKDTGVILKFKPTIMEDTRRVRLDLSPEISEIDNSITVASIGGVNVYGFKTRKVNTTVELMDGETLVIAGLKQNSSSRSKAQIPVLGNVPVLGTLFGITNDDKRDNEVVIFITPRIVDNSIGAENL